MRKMFTRLFTVAILLVISIAYQANASPPDDIGSACTYMVVSPDLDNFVINQVAPDVEVYNYSAPELATAETVYTEVSVSIIVREVAYSRKISISKAESGSATENAVMAYNTTCTDNNVTQSPPLRNFANVATKNYLAINLQHTNYGYPLSANKCSFFHKFRFD